MEDSRLSQALEFANYRQTLNNQLQKTKIKTEGALTISKNGGIFKIDQQLICFLDYISRIGVKTATLLDNNNSPINVDDIESFLKEITVLYFEITNDYFIECQQIKKARSVKSVLQIND